MQINAENCMRNVDKCREMKRNVEKFRKMQICRYILMTFMTFMTFMTHGNVIFDILETLAFKNIAHVEFYRNLKNYYTNFPEFSEICDKNNW